MAGRNVRHLNMLLVFFCHRHLAELWRPLSVKTAMYKRMNEKNTFPVLFYTLEALKLFYFSFHQGKLRFREPQRSTSDEFFLLENKNEIRWRQRGCQDDEETHPIEKKTDCVLVNIQDTNVCFLPLRFVLTTSKTDVSKTFFFHLLRCTDTKTGLINTESQFSQGSTDICHLQTKINFCFPMLLKVCLESALQRRLLSDIRQKQKVEHLLECCSVECFVHFKIWWHAVEWRWGE